jgi:hypothetical protein
VTKKKYLISLYQMQFVSNALVMMLSDSGIKRLADLNKILITYVISGSIYLIVEYLPNLCCVFFICCVLVSSSADVPPDVFKILGQALSFPNILLMHINPHILLRKVRNVRVTRCIVYTTDTLYIKHIKHT